MTASMDDDASVTISDGYSRLRLIPIGPPKLGFPTRIKVECGPFAVAAKRACLLGAKKTRLSYRQKGAEI
jgi:hypothetical protein